MNGKRYMPNEAAMASTLKRPGIAVFLARQEEQKDVPERPTLPARLLIWSGFAMAETNNPRGWQWNPATLVTVLTFILFCLGMVATASWFASRLNFQQEQVLEELKEVKAAAKAADDRAQDAIVIAMGGSTEPTPTPKEKK